jgi:hypothetical protein
VFPVPEVFVYSFRMAKKNKKNCHFVNKGPATAPKKRKSGESCKMKQHGPNIDILIKTSNPTLLNGLHRCHDQVLSGSPAAETHTSKSTLNTWNRIEDRKEVGQRKLKKRKNEWHSQYENLLERGYAATVSSHSETGKRKCSNPKHTTATRQDLSSTFHLQAATFSTNKTTNDLLTDATGTLSSFQLMPSSRTTPTLDPYPNKSRATIYNGSDAFPNEARNIEKESSRVQIQNRFQVLNDDNEDVGIADSKQRSFSFAFHPPSFVATPVSELPPTASLSLLHILNTNDDVDPDL